ncbi:amidohydrolase-like protein [Psychromonas ingrahamii 37]|uniref:Amidohydrolase-like protein n=1 Tax=Psychromonas ingrahamii (strain DSM 17664 / CCUG 51855 / 37) TaxID=357804 RepID=A1SV53_PSYIN|nr:carbon-nitrogen hydrolase family protein [Psychromonas ingrahamii]ABM03368.1 amidohydrolase-like protein [Psychromonas ingrahamii 37]
MKITYIESPEGLLHEGTKWEELKQQIISEKPEVLVTNEMPFGSWLAVENEFNTADAEASISAHNYSVDALKKLNIPIVLSSRPVPVDNKLANEAFALVNGEYRFAHQKHYFPEESGFYETAWFRTGRTGFDVIKTDKLNVGFLLCTELMFNEWARSYRSQDAHLIVIPRASEQGFERWKTAVAMAAIVSGCYVVSANRVGKCGNKLIFGGKGFAFSPDGSLISETPSDNPVVSFHLDFGFVDNQQKQYPCYVHEIGLKYQ